MKKICFLVEKVGPYHHFRLEQLKELQPVCIETRPCSQRYGWKETQKLTNGCSIVSLPKKSYTSLANLLKEITPDIVFITGYGFKEMLWGLSWAMKNKVPVVLQSDSTVLDEARMWYKEWIKKQIIRCCTAAFVAGSRSRSYIESLGMNPLAVFAPYDVVDNSFFSVSKRPFRNGRPFLLCVSRLVPQKNLFFLIDVFKNVGKDVDLDLVILGNGELEADLLNYIKLKNLQGRVHLKGFVQKEEIRDHYLRAEALILASTSEPWGLCVNEAMAAGLPILISNHCGAAADLVKDGVNGYVFTPTNKELACLALQKFLSLSGSEQKRMGERSQEIISMYNSYSYKQGIEGAIKYALTKKPISDWKYYALIKGLSCGID